METEDFLKYLQHTNQLDKVEHINGDGTPNMKHKYIRDLYHKYLYQQIPHFECSICLEEIKGNMCKLKCGHCFCVDCFSNLARTSNNCALCRKEISDNHIKKKVNENDLLTLVNYEMETAYTDRNNMDISEFIHDQISKLYDNEYKSEYLLFRAVETITMEVFNSLHFVGYHAMEHAMESMI